MLNLLTYNLRKSVNRIAYNVKNIEEISINKWKMNNSLGLDEVVLNPANLIVTKIIEFNLSFAIIINILHISVQEPKDMRTQL